MSVLMQTVVAVVVLGLMYGIMLASKELQDATKSHDEYRY